MWLVPVTSWGNRLEWCCFPPALEPAFQGTVTHWCSFQWHSRTLIPRDGAQHLPHDPSEQLRLCSSSATPQCHPSVPGLQSSLCPRGRVRQWQENQRGEGTAPGNAHTSPRDAAMGLQAPSPRSTWCCHLQGQSRDPQNWPGPRLVTPRSALHWRAGQRRPG